MTERHFQSAREVFEAFVPSFVEPRVSDRQDNSDSKNLGESLLASLRDALAILSRVKPDQQDDSKPLL